MMTAEEVQEQRLASLHAGNKVRFERARVKRDVHLGAMDPALPLLERDPRLDGMTVEIYLKAVPGLGAGRIKEWRKECPWKGPDTTLGALTDRQRAWLVMSLHNHVTQSKRYQNALQGFERLRAAAAA